MSRLVVSSALLFCAVGLPWACSLQTGGVGVAESAEGGSADGTTLPDSQSGDDGSVTPDVVESDAGLDAQGDAAPDGDAAVVDAPPDVSVDADPCSASCVGGTCDAGRCFLSCTSAAQCATNPCPPGIPCSITCQGNAACGNISCSNCDIRCVDNQSCNGNLSCTGPNCTVRCCSNQACNGNVDCTGAGCGIVCALPNACNGNETCNGAACVDSGRQCN